ncbi:hypothetical protein [Streptomyces sp. NPDC093060]|uniref:hypothetical protein n=1 Tax=Streptomyces sp. NPDC093060 TaxID=3366019 RepID=UPI0038158A7C
MRLDSAAADGRGGGGAADLKTSTSGNRAAVKALRVDIRPGTDKAGSHADEGSAAVVREFSGWDTGAGLKDAHAEWELQVNNLKGRLDADQSALEQTHSHFQYTDYGVRSRIAQVDAGHDRRRGA